MTVASLFIIAPKLETMHIFTDDRIGEYTVSYSTVEYYIARKNIPLAHISQISY